MKVDIVTHCWRFSRALAYQISSLILNPPRLVQVNLHVCYAPEDEGTVRTLGYFREKLYGVECDQLVRRLPPRNINLTCWPFEVPSLVNRTIARNSLAKTTTADCIWMCDADYVFGKDCLDGLAYIDWKKVVLAYPANYRISSDHATGQRYLDALADGPDVVQVHEQDFRWGTMRKAIGGAQIFSGDVARAHGYCDACPGLLKPYEDGKWKASTRGDTMVRRILKTVGTPITLPNLFRIRQLVENVCDV